MDFACCGLGVHHYDCDFESLDELPHHRNHSDLTVQLGGVVQRDVLGLGLGIQRVECMEVGGESDIESSSEETTSGLDPMGLSSGRGEERWNQSWNIWKGKTHPMYRGRSESTLTGPGIACESEIEVEYAASDVAMMPHGVEVAKRRSKMWGLVSWRESEIAGLVPKARVMHHGHGQLLRGVSADI